jgi:hypothetical protein
MPNITDAIFDYAQGIGLDYECTGGNCDAAVMPVLDHLGARPDYISRDLGKGRKALLVTRSGGESPDRLNEPSDIVIYTKWAPPNTQYVIPFPTAKMAMDAMAHMTVQQT